MSERLRRGLGIGAVAVAGALLVEVLVSLPGNLSSLSARDLGRLVWVALVFGGGMGAVLGAAIAAMMPTSTSRRAWVVTLLLLPAWVWGAFHLFEGPRAQRIPARLPLAVAIVLVAVLLARLVWGRFFVSRRRSVWALAASFLVVALAVADRLVLPRLYPWFHVELGLAGLAAGALAAAVWVPLPGRRGTVGLLALMLLAVPSLWWLDRQRPTRHFVLEYSPWLGRSAGWLRSWRPSPTMINSADEPPPAKLEWPHLGDVDLVLITIDAWRGDRMTSTLTPRMHAFAAGGAAFDRAYTAVPHTSFAVAALMTGRSVAAEGAAGANLKDFATLPGVLRTEGYKTAAFYPPSAFYIDRPRLAPFEASGYDFEYVKLEYLDAPRRTDQVIAFFEAERPRRAFVWVHYLEPHEPYDPHPGITTSQDPDVVRYDGEIRAVDGEVGRLVDWLSAHRRRAVVAITADHGEELGEHGGRYHGTTLYEEQIRVPLTVFSLGGEPRIQPGHVRQPVGLVDLAPTLLALADVTRPPGMNPNGFAPWLGLGGSAKPIFVELGARRAVVDGDDKLICDLSIDSCALFDLRADPGEKRPRLDAAGEAIEATLRAKLARFAVVTAAAAKVDPVGAWVARAQQGDAAAIAKLPSLVRSEPAPATRVIIARALVDLPLSRLPDHLGAELAATTDPQLARLGRVLGARQGTKPLSGDDLDALCSESDHALCARAALLQKSVSHLGGVLPQLDDENLALEVIDALGRTHDEKAYAPLVTQLGTVRTRRQTVEALERLGRSEVVPTLARLAPADPYTLVRVAMAHALGVLSAKAAGRSDGIAALRLLAVEREPEVRAAACSALLALGQPRCTQAATQSK